jgi:hypothetical protein
MPRAMAAMSYNSLSFGAAILSRFGPWSRETIIP